MDGGEAVEVALFVQQPEFGGAVHQRIDRLRQGVDPAESVIQRPQPRELARGSGRDVRR